ncbi:MAG: Holliday junction DNA helicase [uncultured bacterium (gcode 4)]|uniref:Holliday junction branch migration complex subunit RuvA n=1 Tax=uncultured bacterium (gcode 4) TaxID=1234023 RepID=K2F5S4_9BACT|nr:MAG: Holliday junction DNA helicase [uncultured bacterium (gcode 4)]
MYSYIKWNILSIEDSKISVCVNNTWLGLEIFVSPITLSKLKSEDEIELQIYHHITEVSQTLFWFENLSEKKLFKSLLKIDWIWGKAAINILWLWIYNLFKAIEENDDKLLATIPWVGKKTALKIILEMKNKVEAWDLFSENKNLPLTKPHSIEIIETLTSMWYDKKKVEEIVKNIPWEITELKDKVIYCIKVLSGN